MKSATARSKSLNWKCVSPKALERTAPLATVLQQVLDRCLAKAPDERFPNAQEVLAELAAVYEQAYDRPPPPASPLGVLSANDYAAWNGSCQVLSAKVLDVGGRESQAAG